MIPHIVERNGLKQLIVNGKPFIMLAGEVHNSNSSSAEYMEGVWKKAEELGLNSVLLPVSWEIVEPKEGVFDFTLVGQLIMQAREHNMKIGFLWFGAWKNAQCYYAPEWVKSDTTRFRRAEIVKGKSFIKGYHNMPYTTLSALCEDTMIADGKAFAKFMEYLKQVDESEQTVVVVQVENETGILGAAREQSDLADQMFHSEVPEKLIHFLSEHKDNLHPVLKEHFADHDSAGDWTTYFGEMAEEAFTAYYTAKFVGYVAEQGKKEYPLPMAANCWIDKGQEPGKYPTGGPVAKVMDIWKCAAPNIEIIAPDIYVPYFSKVCDAYTVKNNPLFIAECATHSYAGLREVYAVGHYHAMCYSPFGFEDMGLPFSIIQGVLFGMDTEDEALKTPQSIEEYAKINDFLQQIMPQLTNAYGTDHLDAVISENGGSQQMRFDKFTFNITFDSKFIQRKNGVCLVLQERENEFLVLVTGGTIEVSSTDQALPYADYLKVEEGRFQDSEWKAGRRINGDEITLLNFEDITLLKMKLLAYQ